MKAITVNTVAAIVTVLFIIGGLNMSEAMVLVDYVNDHTSTSMAVVYYVSIFSLLFLFPVVSGVAIETFLVDSNTRIGRELSNVIYNVRNSWVALIACGVAGGTVTFFTVWGSIQIICG